MDYRTCVKCGYRYDADRASHPNCLNAPEPKAPLFTRQHHEAIIQVLHIALEGAPEYEYDGINSLKEDLGIMLANDNPEFDRHKFDDA